MQVSFERDKNVLKLDSDDDSTLCKYATETIELHPLKGQILYVNYSSIKLFFREGNGTPLQYSCLENPMDGGAW